MDVTIKIPWDIWFGVFFDNFFFDCFDLHICWNRNLGWLWLNLTTMTIIGWHMFGKFGKPLQVKLVIQSRRQGQEKSRIVFDRRLCHLYHDVHPLELLDPSALSLLESSKVQGFGPKPASLTGPTVVWSASFAHLMPATWMNTTKKDQKRPFHGWVEVEAKYF